MSDQAPSRDDRSRIEVVLDDYMDKSIGRRDFFRQAGAVGLSMSAAAAFLAACGGSSSSTSTAAAGGEAVAGGVFLEGYDRDVSRLDPVATPWWDASLFPCTHETLVAANADGDFIPLLASEWTTSDDGLTWTFTIQDGLKFQSGAACDAAAIKAALDQIRTEGVNAGFWGPVKKIAAESPTELVISLTNPYADLPFVLNSGYSAIFNKKVRDKDPEAYGVKVVDGTGPFTLKKFVAGDRVSLERWEDYPGVSDPFYGNDGVAYLDGVEFVSLREPAVRAQEMEAGNVNALHGPAAQDVDRLKANSDLTVIEFEEWGMYQLGVNFKLTDNGFDNVNVRQAISHAIDRQGIADAVFFGQAVPAYTLVNPAFPWYEDSVEADAGFDPDLSKQLLTDAGFEPGDIKFTAIVEEDKTEQQVAQAVVEMLSDVGVTLELNVLGAEYWEVAFDNPDGYFLHNVWPYMFDASLLFADSEFVPPACCNLSYSKVAELDSAFEAWQTAADEAELEAAARDAQTVFAETLPFIPIVTPLNVWVHNETVQGWMPTQPNLYPFYQGVSLTDGGA